MSNLKPFNKEDRQTSMEIAMQINGQGHTTSKDLYEYLELNKAHYSRWCRANMEDNIFAEENADYWAFTINGECGGQATTNYEITSDFAKKLAMASGSRKGEAARDYFICVENNLKEAAKNFKSGKIQATPFGPCKVPSFEKPKSGLEILTELFNQNSNRLPQQDFEASYKYLWHALTADMPVQSVTPVLTVPTAPMPPTPQPPQSRRFSATNAVADIALESVKEFIKKHPKSFEPRYGFVEPEYIYIRSSLISFLFGKKRKSILNNWADRDFIKFRVNPDYRGFTRKRVDRFLHKDSDYVAVKASLLK